MNEAELQEKLKRSADFRAAGADRDQVFPVLSPAQLARLAPLARERRFQDGAPIFEMGDRHLPLLVLLEGEIAILTGDDQVMTHHGPGTFTGDVDLLSGRPVIVKARARGATRVLEIPAERLRSLVQTDAELSETFLRAFLLRRLGLLELGLGGLVLIGSRHSAGTLELQEFLTRNSQPHAYLDLERDPAVEQALATFQVCADDLPVLICMGRHVMKKPTLGEVAGCLDLNRVDEALHDLVVIGAGPAGLASAVYGASEGLDVLVVEANAPGGQAGSSSRIENYLGFSTGISGQNLARQALLQSQKFGAKLAVARAAAHLACDRRPFRVQVGEETFVRARTVIVATGVRYRRPDVPDLGRFEGVGVYYGATQIEANACRAEDVVVVGGGNSAGQAAVFLAGQGCRVHLLVRGAGLGETMSRYLIRRIEENPSIVLRTRTQIEALEGNGRLQRVRWHDAASGESTTAEIRHVFLMTGASPNTAWLDGCVALDSKGFVKTGQDLGPGDGWPLERPPLLFETSVPGVFAVGDVRAGSVKRVAAAVGEGSVCVQLVHRVLAEAAF